MTYSGTGFTVVRRDPREETDGWAVGLFLTGFGARSALTPDAQAFLNVQKERAHIQHGPVTIRYQNGREGMRQDFVLERKPTAEPGLALVLSVALDGVACGLLRVPGNNGNVSVWINED